MREPKVDAMLIDTWRSLPLVRWWRMHVVGSIDHEGVIARVEEDGGWSPRYLFMLMMSGGIAVLGLLLSSPAVVIGAMLISPLMGPILALGFSLALFDFAEMRRALIALALGAGLAILFTAMIVVLSPLKAATPEILARTRPNLFDLLVALFSALAGAFALIRGRGETIVGVAIATALMPPLATVGYGIATANSAVAAGAFALFVTNFVTIALAAMVMARLYGFGHQLSSQQTWLQTAILIGVFVVMAIPLGISLSRIAREAVTTTQIRSVLTQSYGDRARVTQLDINFDTRPIAVRTVIIAPKSRAIQPAALTRAIEQRVGEKVTLQADQVLLDPASATLDQEKAALLQSEAQQQSRAEGDQIARLVAVAAGVDPSQVLLDRDNRRATVAARTLPGAGLIAYKMLEDRVTSTADGWTIAIIPPAGLTLPAIDFADDSDALDGPAQQAVQTIAWAAQRWNLAAIRVPGYTTTPGDHPLLATRRAGAVAAMLLHLGVTVDPGARDGTEQHLVTRPATP